MWQLRCKLPLFKGRANSRSRKGEKPAVPKKTLARGQVGGRHASTASGRVTIRQACSRCRKQWDRIHLHFSLKNTCRPLRAHGTQRQPAASTVVKAVCHGIFHRRGLRLQPLGSSHLVIFSGHKAALVDKSCWCVS